MAIARCVVQALLMTGLWIAPVCGDSLRGEPVVVFKHPRAISARPYWEPLLQGEQETRGTAVTAMPKSAVAAGRASSYKLAIEDRLPLYSSTMRSAEPALYIQPGMSQPLFIVGMDTTSLTWLTRHMETLVSLGATGLVVEAGNLEDWVMLRDAARQAGVSLQLFDSDSLVEVYTIDSYPTLIVSPELAASLGAELVP